MIELDFLMELTAEVRALVIGSGPFGQRQLFEILGGEFKGPRLAGKVLPSGGDWMLLGDDNVGRLDVRMMLQTNDDALIYMQFSGVLEINDRVVAAWSGQHESEFDDAYYVTQPRFETGDKRYAFLNRIVGLGEGRLGRNRVDYRIYRAVKG
jgi:hypothetical protein